MSDKPPMPANLDPRDLTSFADAKTAIEDFERVLLSYGIKIVPGSDLEAICLNIMEMESKRLRKTRLDLMEDIRPVFRKSVSLLEFVKMLSRQHHKTGLQAFVPHLNLLNTAKGVAQNVRVVSDEATNKVFELFVAMMCLGCGTDLILDDPKNAKGTNPDILVIINGRCWGFACKVIEGKSPLSWFELLEKGVEQIEKSPAEVGCVVFNAKNLIDHDATWPILNEAAYLAGKEEPLFGCWQHEGYITGHLAYLADFNHTQLVEMNTEPEIQRIFAQKKSLPVSLSFLQTTSSIRTNVGPLTTTIGTLALAEFGRITANDFSVFQALNEALHHRLG